MKIKFTILVALLLVIFLSVSAYAYWIWTPETKKWVNPKYAVKDSPEEQFKLSVEYYDAKEYARAIKEFRKLIYHYPLSVLAAEAQYYMGMSYENLENYHQAFSEYQKTIKKYPYTKRTDEIIEKQYQIGNLFYSGKKRKVLGMSILPAEDKAVEIFSSVVENSPYGKYAAAAQYKLGLCYRERGDFAQARKEFEKLLNEYPKSSLVDDARYQIAVSSLEDSLDYCYDQGNTDKALENFKEVIIKSDKKDIVTEESIDTAIDKLKEKKAKKTYKTAEFYERLKQFKSARIYYNEVIEDFSGSMWAAKALERLQVIKKKE